MNREAIIELVREIIGEMNLTGAVGGYMTPKAFSKKGQGKNLATKTAEKLGYTTIKRPKRPSHTKMFDYLDENK